LDPLIKLNQKENRPVGKGTKKRYAGGKKSTSNKGKRSVGRGLEPALVRRFKTGAKKKT